MDTEKLLRLLKENNAEFIVIGASAFPVYGYARATLDIDILIRPGLENIQNVIKALKEFGYDLMGLTPEDFLIKINRIQTFFEKRRGLMSASFVRHKIESSFWFTP